MGTRGRLGSLGLALAKGLIRGLRLRVLVNRYLTHPGYRRQLR